MLNEAFKTQTLKQEQKAKSKWFNREYSKPITEVDPIWNRDQAVRELLEIQWRKD